MTANDRDAARGATESDVHAQGVLGDVPPVSGARLARYAEAIEGAVAFLTRLADYAETDDLRGQALGHAEELRGVDAEQAELKAEVERWVEKANEAGKAYADANTKHHEELDRANRLEGMCERRLVEVISSTLGCDIQAWQDRVTGEWDANCETCGANADEDGCLNAQRLATAVDRLLHTAPSGSDEQGDRPATPDANGVHDTKGGDGR